MRGRITACEFQSRLRRSDLSLFRRSIPIDIHPITMSHRKIAVIVGFLFIVQMITFMMGSALIKTYLNGEAGENALRGGFLLEMLSGLAVVSIGFLMYRILAQVDPKLALLYPIFRIIEFVTSAALGLYLLDRLQEFPHHLLWVYLPTALGGLVLTHLLFISRLVPRAIAAIGLIGYMLLLIGVPLGMFDLIDVNAGSGMAVLAPGGIFEFILLPFWLIVRGFSGSRPSVVPRSRSARPVRERAGAE